VHSRELFARGRPRRDDFRATRSPAIRDGVHHLGALRPFRMTGRGLMLGEALGVNEDDGHLG
jgi:hypothetical protein